MILHSKYVPYFRKQLTIPHFILLVRFYKFICLVAVTTIIKHGPRGYVQERF